MPRIRSEAAYFSPQVFQTRRFYHADWRRQAAGGSHVLVVGGGCEWCSPDFLVERKSFPFLAFEFVSSGRGQVRFGRQWHELSAGLAYFFDGTIPHTIRSDRAEPMVKYFCNFAGARAATLRRGLKLRPGVVFRVAEPARLAELLEEAIDSALQGDAAGLRGAAVVLEHALVRYAARRSPSETRPDPAYATYLRCRNFLLRRYPGLGSINEAARACAVSAAYLTRLFQRYDRETPFACLRRLKMNEALLKLRQPGAQAKAVAAELAFKSAAHFSRAFREFHRRSPSDAMRG